MSSLWDDGFDFNKDGKTDWLEKSMRAAIISQMCDDMEKEQEEMNSASYTPKRTSAPSRAGAYPRESGEINFGEVVDHHPVAFLFIAMLLGVVCYVIIQLEGWWTVIGVFGGLPLMLWFLFYCLKTIGENDIEQAKKKKAASGTGNTNKYPTYKADSTHSVAHSAPATPKETTKPLTYHEKKYGQIKKAWEVMVTLTLVDLVMLFWAIHTLSEVSALVNSKHMVGPGIMTLITGVLFVGFLVADYAIRARIKKYEKWR